MMCEPAPGPIMCGDPRMSVLITYSFVCVGSDAIAYVIEYTPHGREGGGPGLTLTLGGSPQRMHGTCRARPPDTSRLAELEAKAEAQPSAGEREAALAAERERAAVADAQRAAADKKAQELADVVRKLQEKVRSHDAGILSKPAGRPRPEIAPLPIAAIRAATAAAISATTAEGEESEAMLEKSPGLG